MQLVQAGNTVNGKNKWETWCNILLIYNFSTYLFYTLIDTLPRMVSEDAKNLFSAIYRLYGLENKSIWVVFRTEFDGDIRFVVAPRK